MSVDLDKIEKGDEVTVRMRVVEVGGINELNLARIIHGDDHWGAFSFEDVVTHTPRALHVGDRVKFSLSTGELVAIDGDEAWVRWKNGDHSTCRTDRLDRIS